MSNLSVASKSSMFDTIVNSKPGQFVKDNKVLSGAAAVSAGVVLKQAADHSQIASAVVKKGVVPVVSLGVAATGAALVHDAITDDSKRSGGMKILQGTAGAAMTLAGVEVAGQAYGVSPLTKGAQLVANVVPKNVLIGAAASAPGLAAAAWGAYDMKENGVTLGNAAAVDLGSTQASFYGATIAFENAPQMVKTATEKGVGLVASSALGLGAYALGKESLENIKGENWTKAGLYGAGAVVLGAGSAHVLAKTLGAPGLEKVAHLAVKNPIVTGSVVVLGVTAGAYALYNKDK